MVHSTSGGSDGRDVTASDVPAITVDPYTMEVLTDPYPFHHELREAGPVVWLEPHGVWATGRYEQVRAVLTDWETFHLRGGHGADGRPRRPLAGAQLALGVRST